MSDFNANVIDEFRQNGGKVGGMFEGMDLLLLHHVGAKSGQAMVAPLAYCREGGGYAIFASKAGAPNNPGWYHNIKAHPNVTIEVGTDTLQCRATELTGEERDRVYGAMAAGRPQFAEYQQKTTRTIPVILLTPAAG